LPKFAVIYRAASPNSPSFSSNILGRLSKIVNVEAEYLNAGLHAAIIFDKFFLHMANDDFAKVQQQLEATAAELKTANNPDRRRTLLREMSRLVAEAERISSLPPNWAVSPVLNRAGKGSSVIVCALHLG
jgi:hypothetical protein